MYSIVETSTGTPRQCRTHEILVVGTQVSRSQGIVLPNRDDPLDQTEREIERIKSFLEDIGNEEDIGDELLEKKAYDLDPQRQQ